MGAKAAQDAAQIMSVRASIPTTSTTNGAGSGTNVTISEWILQRGVAAMPTRFNTKDSGRRTEPDSHDNTRASK